MITVKIDRSTIRRNPDAGKTYISVPGRVTEYMGVRKQDIQRVNLMCPQPSFWYNYERVNVQCSRCKKSFDYSELEDFADCESFVESEQARICPECGEYECCEEIEYEKLTDEMIEEALDKKVPIGEKKLLSGLASGELRVVAGKVLHIDEVMHNIRVAVEEMNGYDVVMAHNSICANKIRYDEDSVWQYTGEDDNE